MPQTDLYARLELITTDPNHRTATSSASANQVTARNRLTQWGKTLLKYFTGSQEPQITLRRDRASNVYYSVYDPVNQYRDTFDSEHAVRAWLDERYHQ